MERNDRKKYVRLIFSRTFRYFGVMLVISLLLGALLGGGIYLVHALCAMGFVMIAWGWFTYLKMVDMCPFQRNRKQKKAKIPYFHRRFKQQRARRPSFRMDSADFDDDLTSATAVSEEIFTEKQVDVARILARIVCGVLLVLVSFLYMNV